MAGNRVHAPWCVATVEAGATHAGHHINTTGSETSALTQVGIHVIVGTFVNELVKFRLGKAVLVIVLQIDKYM